MNFDAESCKCYCSDDKERILTIITAAYGNLRGFNEAVTRVFRKAGFVGRTDSEHYSDSSRSTNSMASSHLGYGPTETDSDFEEASENGAEGDVRIAMVVDRDRHVRT